VADLMCHPYLSISWYEKNSKSSEAPCI